jgi:ADP-ribose pyrophosphatase
MIEDMPQIRILDREVLYSSFNRVTNYRFEFESLSGAGKLLCEKEIFERKDAAAVVLYDNDRDRLLLVRQFRPGCFIKNGEAFPLEIVAGLIDKTNTPESTAIRETEEESGCVVQKLIKIGSFFPEISFSTREIHMFCAKFDSSRFSSFGGLLEKEGEDVEVLLFSREEVEEKLRNGVIINSHSLIGLQWFFMNLPMVRQKFTEF